MAEGNALDIGAILKQLCGDMSEEEVAQRFYSVGRVTAIAFDSFVQGFADARATFATGGGLAMVAEPEGEPELEEVAEGCAACWCDTCYFLGECDAFQPSPDGAAPPPCAECKARDCAPLLPTSRAADCGTYQPAPKDCVKCWCRQCAEFEGCVVEKKGYDPESAPCPCDGCEKGMCFMPIDVPPTCGRFTPKTNR